MADFPLPSPPDQTAELAALRQQLQEAEDLITAIRTGSIDALAIQSADGPRIFTLEGADQVYRNLIEQMSEGALLLGADGTIIYANASLAALLGRPLPELMGRPLFPLVAPADVDQAQALVARGWAADRVQGEVALLTATGLSRPFSLSLRVLAFPHAAVLGVIATDLSAQQAMSRMQAQVAQQEMHLAQQRLALQEQEAARRAGEQAAAEATRLLEGIPQIAWTTTSLGEHIRFNRRWFVYTGLPATNDPPRHLWDCVDPADVGAAEARWLHSLRTHEALELECRLRNAAGEYRWMLGRALPSYNERGELLEWIGTYTDIDEQKHTQRQLQENHTHLQRTNADLDTFIYTASHDLRQPITNIEGLLQALQEELPAEVQQAGAVQPVLGMMQGAIERFQLTISQLTDVSRLQATHQQALEPVDLAAMVEEVRLDLLPLLTTAGGQLTLDVQACPTVFFSAKNLRSLLYNLLSNALKYGHPDRVPVVHLRGYYLGAHTILEVQDNGLGLSEVQQGKLFRLFRRLHDHVEGSGIGLYMVKKMVENAGGTITVQSQSEVGTTFRVALPDPPAVSPLLPS